MEHPFLATWSSFYTMVGSSAAALTGLMFVVITLVSGLERGERRGDGIGTFSTPTVVHFCSALLVSAILNVPWHVLGYAATMVGLAGFAGVIYVWRVMLRTRRITVYKADLEDWVCYTVLPFVAYFAVLAGAIALAVVPMDGMLAIAGGVILLIFIGIRNAWDIVTYLAVRVAETPTHADDETNAPAESSAHEG